MNEKEVLERFGIGKKLAYGLLIQSIIIIIATILSVNSLIYLSKYGFGLMTISPFICILVCLSLLVYSFIGFNSKKHQEAFFISAIIFYALSRVINILSTNFSLHDFTCILILIQLILVIYFLFAYTHKYSGAQYAMLGVIVLAVIMLFIDLFISGYPWFTCIQFIFIPGSIALTYFERVQRGKYPNLNILK